jgi:hypothetical protein
MAGVTNIFINNLLSSKDTFFKGVYSANEINSIYLQPRESIIVNLSNNYEIGSHFIAFYRKNNTLIYFDSLCFFILDNNLKSFILKHQLKFKYNKKAIQDITSSFCGYYCILFILYIKKHTLSEFIKLFFITQPLLPINDFIVIQYLSIIV